MPVSSFITNSNIQASDRAGTILVRILWPSSSLSPLVLSEMYRQWLRLESRQLSALFRALSRAIDGGRHEFISFWAEAERLLDEIDRALSRLEKEGCHGQQ